MNGKAKIGQLALLVEYDKERGYMFKRSSAIATRLSENKFLQLQEINDFMKTYTYVKPGDVDWTWWSFVSMYLTGSKLYKELWFDVTGGTIYFG